jgi:hypothetical protein
MSLLQLIGDHPLLFGAVVSFLTAIGMSYVPAGAMSPQAIRGLGLVLFGSAAALLIAITGDRDDAFWFFLGGAIGIVLALPLVF